MEDVHFQAKIFSNSPNFQEVWKHDGYFISGLEQGMDRDVISLDSANSDQDIAWGASGVQSSAIIPEVRIPVGMGIIDIRRQLCFKILGIIIQQFPELYRVYTTLGKVEFHFLFILRCHHFMLKGLKLVHFTLSPCIV